MVDAESRRCGSDDQGRVGSQHIRGRGPPAPLERVRLYDAKSVTYPEALAYISRLGRFGMKLGTERTRAILDRIGQPDRGLRGALLAGTTGKGSTGACLASILQASGHRVGFIPKPHLVSYTARIQGDGTPIIESDFVVTLHDLQSTLDAIAVET